MFEIQGNDFLLDGKKYNVYSGAMHYFRIPHEYWEDRLTKLKLAGFNTVETYVCWNLHEPKKGEFCFEGDLDIAEYIAIAGKLGLNVIVRPGPYICAEWEAGGFPAWLFKDKNIDLRCFCPEYLAHVKDFYTKLMSILVPLQCTKGGNIIAMQIENEYGSFGNDKRYLAYMRDMMQELGVEVLTFTSDGDWCNMLSSGTLEGTFKTLNFGSNVSGRMKALDRYPGNGPKMCMEFWCGWFDHWGEKHHTRSHKSIIKELGTFFDIDASFNFYMFHGGTNFGFNAGANHFSTYQPTVTSYDYCALLNEYGDYTPAYHAVRELLCTRQGIPMQELPPKVQLQSIGEVKLTECTGLFENFDNIGTKHHSGAAKHMEYYDQNYGLIYYKTVMKGKYTMGILSIDGLHDRAHVYIDGQLKGICDVTGKAPRKHRRNSFMVSGFDGEREIGVLVEAMGRVNYGNHINDRKGISGLLLGPHNIFDYEVTTLPLDNIDQLDWNLGAEKYPKFFKATFDTTSKADCFVDMKGFSKGYVWVNGHNLGRYWNIGPQRSLYLPGVWLQEKDNEIVVLELDGNKTDSVVISDQHHI
ncbi:MAG: beta-galactosidase [Christensenellales bacterium]